MAARNRPTNRDEFDVAIICALDLEFDAVDVLLDVDWEEDESYNKVDGDPNAYRLGCIGSHNVVLAMLPDMGKRSASTAATWLKVSFRNIRLGLVVGICGGLPQSFSDGRDIILGDIVISTGIIQYDYGRQFPDRFERKDMLEDNLSRPPNDVRAFLKLLESKGSRKLMQDKISTFIEWICQQEGFETSRYPGCEKDQLYESSYRHKHQDSTTCNICSRCKTDADPVCEAALVLSCKQLGCSDRKLVTRKIFEGLGEPRGKSFRPEMHFGRIASGDLVMKSGRHRDQVALKERIIAFEMEGAGVWESFPTVIIKSVCDYADSHKNKAWQKYAAVAAAACTKAFLQEWRAADRSSGPTMERLEFTGKEKQIVIPSSAEKTSYTDYARIAPAIRDEAEKNGIAFAKNAQESIHESIDGRTPVHVAAKEGLTDLMDSLRSLKWYLGVRDHDGWTPMHEAAKHGQIGIIKYLLSFNQDVHVEDFKGRTPIIAAAENGQIETVDYLRSLKQRLDARSEKGRTLMHSAASSGSIALIDYLRSYKLDTGCKDDDGWTPMHFAVEAGQIAMVDYFRKLNNSTYVRTESGATVMHIAAHGGHIKMIDHLRSLGLDISVRNNDGSTPMHYAAKSGQIGVVNYLKSYNQDLGVTNYAGGTLLHCAASNGQVEMVNYLCSQGQDIHVKNIYGSTLMHTAAFNGKIEMVKHLSSLGLSKDVRDKEGGTMMHNAAINGRIEMVNYLYTLGQDVGIKDSSGSTPMHSAARNGHIKMVDHLRSLGQYVNTENDYGKTPLDGAVSNGQTEMVDYILFLEQPRAKSWDRSPLKPPRRLLPNGLQTSLSAEVPDGKKGTARLVLRR